MWKNARQQEDEGHRDKGREVEAHIYSNEKNCNLIERKKSEIHIKDQSCSLRDDLEIVKMRKMVKKSEENDKGRESCTTKTNEGEQRWDAVLELGCNPPAWSTSTSDLYPHE